MEKKGKLSMDKDKCEFTMLLQPVNLLYLKKGCNVNNDFKSLSSLNLIYIIRSENN